jgi:hypothetical protein
MSWMSAPASQKFTWQAVAAVKQHAKIYPLAQAGKPPPGLTFVNL